MDGRGRALDNGFCERKERSIRNENINLMRFGTVRQLQDVLIRDFGFFSHERPRQSLYCFTLAGEHCVR